VDLNHRPRPYQGLLWCYMHSSVGMITLLTTSLMVTSWHDCWFQVARSVQSGDHFLQADRYLSASGSCVSELHTYPLAACGALEGPRKVALPCNVYAAKYTICVKGYHGPFAVGNLFWASPNGLDGRTPGAQQKAGRLETSRPTGGSRCMPMAKRPRPPRSAYAISAN
jgi:hypothetical protein